MNQLQPGQRVRHPGQPDWGLGQVQSVIGDRVTVNFEHAGKLLINGAMVMGLAPVVGVPMPLLSYGGSTMMTVMIGFGLILSMRVHRYVELPKGQGLF